MDRFNYRNVSCALGALLLAVSIGGCAQEVSHSETDKPNWFTGGRTHEESTVYRNPDGTVSTEHEKEVTH